MTSRLVRRFVAPMLLASSLAAAPALAADSFPNRMVTLVAPTTAGGTADLLSRLLGKQLSEIWGQPVVVENRPGAGTLIGSEYVARAKPDGYTLMISFTELATLPALNKNAKLDVVKDLDRIGKIGSLPVFVLTNPSVKAQNMAELIAAMKAAPGKFTYASNGQGSALQLYTEVFKRSADVDVLHIPYRGALEASMAAIAGEVDLLVQFGSGNVVNHVNAGKLRAYAVASPERLKRLPDLPTTAEAGLPDLQLQAWYGLFGPAGIPPDIKAKLNRDLNTVLAQPEIIERFATIGMASEGSTPEAFDAFFIDENKRWTALIEETGIQAN